ncbi:MAG TPA: hypothetical protein VMJ30_02085, partial [Gemmatimonadales bacterium]|nr:hypothetical protein [Gemmatimonadales bacterium]
AQLAGLPGGVVRRAKEMLAVLEGEHRVTAGEPPAPTDPGQLPLFSEPSRPHPVMAELEALDVNALTPLEALNRLAEWKKRAAEK